MTAKKVFSSIIILLITCQLVSAQTKNVDLDNLRYSLSLRLLPSQPLEPLFFTYSAFINSTRPTEERISLYEIEGATRIEGQVKLINNEEAPIAIIVNLGNLIIKNTDIIERREERKNKEGQVISISHYYKLVVNYTFESSYRVMQGDKILTAKTVYSPTNTLKYEGKEYSSRKDANNFWSNNRDVLISDFTDDVAGKTAATATKDASLLYGFPIRKIHDVIQITDEKNIWKMSVSERLALP